MKRTCFVCLFPCLIAISLSSQSNPVPSSASAVSPRVVSSIGASQPNAKAQARISDQYGKLPLSFEANHGQTDSRVKFFSRTGGYSLFLTGDEAVLTWRGSSEKKSSPRGLKPASVTDSGGTAEAGPFPFVPSQRIASGAAPKADLSNGGVLRMKLRNANPAATATGVDELAGTSNYFVGNDPAEWRSNVPTYAKVKYEGIYSGIDLVYYGNQRQLEYDFVVAPGADPRRIAFDISGAKRIRTDEHGDLLFKVGEGEIRWHKPVVYQEKDGARQLVAARYAVTDTNRVAFEVAGYDGSRPLYIDPVVDRLIYSTYLGGSGGDYGYGIAVDSGGNAYVTGLTGSSDFPTMDPLQPAYHGGDEIFVTKINLAGSALVYSTYLGGTGDEYGVGIAVDGAGNAYVTGSTNSTDFPTKKPLQAANSGGAHDAFVVKINPAGSALVYSTYLGGSGDDESWGIAADSAGNAYITGFTDSSDFPTTPGAFQTVKSIYQDAFVAKISSSGSALLYSTFLGGNYTDNAWSIAVDSAGNAYVTGTTGSSDFPTTPGAYRTTCLSQCEYGEPFVTKLNPTGSALVYSTYLGGEFFDVGYGIAVDTAGDAYIFVFRSLSSYLALLYKVNPAGSGLVYYQYIKKSTAYAIAVDSSGSAYVTGDGGIQKGVFIFKYNSAGSFVSSTYLHGNGDDLGYAIAVDSSNRAYVTGFTDSTNFPTKNPLQATLGGGPDAYVAKLDMGAPTTTTVSSSPNPSIYGQAVTFTAVVSSSFGAPADGEIVTFVEGTAVLGTGTISGGSASFTTSTLKAGTNTIKAVYGGDLDLFGSTSKNAKQVVNEATTTTAVASSQNPSNFGQPVTFTATVTPQLSGTPPGDVIFKDGTTVLKTVALSGGVAEFTTSKLATGVHTITATYRGSKSFEGSSGSLTQTVN